jgi:hypothetical protein
MMTPIPTLWRWTAIFVHALRQALCPSPGLLALIGATARGDLSLDLNDRRRRRTLQSASFSSLLEKWILG